uniref:Fucolectin tachylectin-4 pentraxin-1 domain-containing protein n=1 Tax=Leptobrachium leishanense TaxID=445787 RepID=A0A8C5R052_9ANUR
MSKHCSHTAQDAPPWWRLDLTKVYNVTRVKVTNRGDCCSERIDGAEIRIGLSPEHGGTKNPKNRPYEDFIPEYICGMVGQYVTVTIPDRPEYLTLCEVKVYGEEKIFFYADVNLALRGISSQSSTYDYLGAAENAIDGSRSTNYMSGHCTHTAQDAPPWWRLDLTKVYNVTRVKVTNRGDCCSERIDGAEIRIGSSPEHGGIKNPKNRPYEDFIPEYICGMVGQYVTVTIPDGPEYLTLCEVKVYGEEVIGNYTVVNLALRGISSQSSTYDYLGAAENAIDGSSSTNYLSKHCSHTHLDIEPWWKLDLRKVYNVTRVKVTNRGDCCNERLNGAVIRIGLSPEHGGTLNSNCGTVSSIGLGETVSFNCDGMVGRYVTIVIPGETRSLSLCEVQVFGVPTDKASKYKARWRSYDICTSV